MIQAFAFWNLIKNTIIEQENSKKSLETTMNTFTRLQRTEIRIQFDKEGTFLKIYCNTDFWNYSFSYLFLDSISETPQFVWSKQGKPQLLDSEGYIYYKGSQHNKNTYWYCSSNYKTKCKARFIIDDTSLCVVRYTTEHNH